MDNQVKNILRYALILFIITAVSAALLAGINMLTKDKISENALLAENEALGEVMAQAKEFESLDEASAIGYGAKAIYIAKDEAGIEIGYCVKMAQNGYGGEIVSIIGVSQDGLVSGVSIISHSETPGLGAKLVGENFKGQFVGKGKVSVVKAGAKEGEINAISGATISSKALTSSVNAAVDICEKIKKEGAVIQ